MIMTMENRILKIMKESSSCSNALTVSELQSQLMPRNNSKRLNLVAARDTVAASIAAMLLLTSHQHTKTSWVEITFLQPLFVQSFRNAPKDIRLFLAERIRLMDGSSFASAANRRGFLTTSMEWDNVPSATNTYAQSA